MIAQTGTVDGARLGELPLGAVVFHPLWRMGKVVGGYENGTWVMFVPEYDHRTKKLVREGAQRFLSNTERVAVWQSS